MSSISRGELTPEEKKSTPLYLSNMDSRGQKYTAESVHVCTLSGLISLPYHFSGLLKISFFFPPVLSDYIKSIKQKWLGFLGRFRFHRMISFDQENGLSIYIEDYAKGKWQWTTQALLLVSWHLVDWWCYGIFGFRPIGETRIQWSQNFFPKCPALTLPG